MTTRTEFVENIIYDVVANMMPSLGRDFIIELNVVDDNSLGTSVPTNIKFEALTPIGKAVLPFIVQGLDKTLTTLNKRNELDNLYKSEKQQMLNRGKEFIAKAKMNDNPESVFGEHEIPEETQELGVIQQSENVKAIKEVVTQNDMVKPKDDN